MEKENQTEYSAYLNRCRRQEQAFLFKLWKIIQKKQHCRKYRFPIITKKDFKDYNDSKVLVVQ